MNAAAKLSDLIFSIESESVEVTTRYDRQAGRIVSVDSSVLRAVEEGEQEHFGDLRPWVAEELKIASEMVADGGDRFIAPPDKFRFHEYRHMEQFIHSLNDQAAVEKLWRAITGKGAFRHFKNTLHDLGLLEEWFAYRDSALKEYVIGWAEANQVPFEDDLPDRKTKPQP